MAERIRIYATPAVAATAAEADALGVTPGRLIEADLSRLRDLATVAVAALGLDAVETEAIARVLDGEEFARLIDGDPSIPSGSWLAAGLQEIADGRPHDEMLALDGLARRAATWTPLMVLGLLMRVRR